ncbi:hypothetical protein BGW41_002824 [Actinomortierella wolfii]|nr:hypothetical protein BGW41_002824 [Actinomortierella wolfii]
MSHSPDNSISPPNQPRRSLSTNLQPDYHDWVTNATTTTLSVPPTAAATETGRSSEPTSTRQSLHRPSSAGSQTLPSSQHPPSVSSTSHSLLDAVAQKILPSSSSSTQRRRPRPNQPSFTGSISTTDGGNDDNDPDPRADLAEAREDAEPPRLPSLEESQVPVLDPSRPAFKLGRPNSRPKPQEAAPLTSTPPSSARRNTPPQRPQHEQHQGEEEYTESSALLGRSPNGSRRRIPRYSPHESLHPHDSMEDDEGDDEDNQSYRSDASENMSLLRRPSRARSMSPTLGMRRGGMGGRTGLSFRDNDHPHSHHRKNRHRHSPTDRPYGSNKGSKRSSTFNRLRRSSFANIKDLKAKLLSRRKTVYDDAKEALVRENNGIRVWYHNYTTIDWIHDFVKERVRLRQIRSYPGLRGRIINWADSLKGWVLVLLTGVITACLAAFIDVFSWWLGDLRMGYCKTNFWWSQYFCCWQDDNAFKPHQLISVNATLDSCPEWTSWSEAISWRSSLGLSDYTFDWVTYIAFGLLFATVCVVMVTSDGTVSIQRAHGATKGRPGIPFTNSKASFESTFSAVQPKKIAYFGAGSGIPEVKTILGGFVIRGFLGFRTLMIKLIGLPLMVAAGLNMGKQGPLVHIACCVGNIVCRIFDKYNRNDGKRREILSAAAASGVAVAFGAPIGGVLFSLEEVSYYFPSKTMWRSYFCALISAVVLKLINPYRVGKTVLFQVTYDSDWHLFEAIPFFFISVFGGAYGAIFSQFHMSYTRFRSKTWIGRHPVQEVMIVTIITCAIQWLNPWTRVNLLQLLTNLYSECTPTNSLNGMCAVQADQIYPILLLLAEVFVMKVLLNFITFGVKVPGGIFVPTMVAGAVFGRMVGLFMQWLIAKYPEHQMFQVCEGDSMDCIIPGLYAMIGAAACLAGVTRMTVSLVVIMFELTGAMTYALPIMMAVMIGKFVGDAFSPDAFFNKLIALNEHPYLDSKKDYNTFGTAADIADRYLETIEVNEVNTVETLRRKLEVLIISGYSDGGLPIVDNGILVGYIASNELAHALGLAEQKHPDCVCIFRNRASSNHPAPEVVLPPALQADLEQQGRREFLDGRDPLITVTPPPRRTQQQQQQQDYTSYQHSDAAGRAGFFIPDEEDDDDNRSASSSYSSSVSSMQHQIDTERGYYVVTDAGYVPAGRISSVATGGTSELIEHPGLTMDFTPFTDQAPLAVSLFSSMDLVVELFIKLGLKYVCVVKAGEHYGMIHKKQLLTFLKENEEKQRRYQGHCC